MSTNEFPASNITIRMTGPAMTALLAAEPTLTIQMGQQVCEQFAKRYLQSIGNHSAFAALKKSLEAELDKAVESTMGKLTKGYYGDVNNIAVKPEILNSARAQVEVACTSKLNEMVATATRAVIDTNLKAIIDQQIEYRITDEIKTRVKTKVEAILRDVMNGKLDEVIKKV